MASKTKDSPRTSKIPLGADSAPYAVYGYRQEILDALTVHCVSPVEIHVEDGDVLGLEINIEEGRLLSIYELRALIDTLILAQQDYERMVEDVDE